MRFFSNESVHHFRLARKYKNKSLVRNELELSPLNLFIKNSIINFFISTAHIHCSTSEEETK